MWEAHKKIFTLIFTSILISVFYSRLPVEFLEYTVSEESSFRFQGISVSAFCLSCMTPCTDQDFNLYLRAFMSLGCSNFYSYGYGRQFSKFTFELEFQGVMPKMAS